MAFACKPFFDKVYVCSLEQTVLYVDSRGAVFPHRATVSICGSVSTAKGDDLKQIVKLPARNECAVSGINCYSEIQYTIMK